ncbi:MAG TPA: hypothetical protein VFE14_15750 [Micromonosporaceae bacterium]|nr:hypothetical protein [Micromonosporaceae bacterium]
MLDLLVPQTLFQWAVVLTGALATCAASLFYVRRIRLDRPAIGVFNGRDIGVLFVFITTLPVLYLALPHWALTTFLILTFTASLSIGYRPVLPPAVLWLGIGVLLGVNVWIARTMLGSVLGWQLYWAETSVVVLLGATAVANLYAQGGMRLRHVAWFALFLAVYDVIFSVVIPLTPKLADAFIGYPLDPSIGMRVGIFNANIGIGDLLVYGLFTVTALKAYGRRAGRIAIGVVAVFGATAPSLAPLILDAVTRGNANAVVPAQAFFGPPAFLTYVLLRRRYGRERTMGEFLTELDASRSGDRARDIAPVSPAVAGAVRDEALTH